MTTTTEASSARSTIAAINTRLIDGIECDALEWALDVLHDHGAQLGEQIVRNRIRILKGRASAGETTVEVEAGDPS